MPSSGLHAGLRACRNERRSLGQLGDRHLPTQGRRFGLILGQACGNERLLVVIESRGPVDDALAGRWRQLQLRGAFGAWRIKRAGVA